jgi:hypothetical protein
LIWFLVDHSVFDANFVLAGDFNVPLLDNQICPLSNCITNFMSSVEAIQINDVLNVNRRRLDLIFCPSSSSFTIQGVFEVEVFLLTCDSMRYSKEF